MVTRGRRHLILPEEDLGSGGIEEIPTTNKPPTTSEPIQASIDIPDEILFGSNATSEVLDALRDLEQGNVSEQRRVEAAAIVQQFKQQYTSESKEKVAKNEINKSQPTISTIDFDRLLEENESKIEKELQKQQIKDEIENIEEKIQLLKNEELEILEIIIDFRKQAATQTDQDIINNYNRMIQEYLGSIQSVRDEIGNSYQQLREARNKLLKVSRN